MEGDLPMGRDAKIAAIALTLTLVLSLGSPVQVAAQDVPRASVLAGVGNTSGWVGGQLAGYLAQGRISPFVGVGRIPNSFRGEGDGVGGALGIRGFTSGDRHRGLLELSYSMLSNSVRIDSGSGFVEESRNYGPGVALGYQFIGKSGFTMMVTGGVGLDDEEFIPGGTELQSTLGLGFGYTWR